MENSNAMIDKVLQVEGTFPFYFENIYEPTEFNLVNEIIVVNELLQKLAALKLLIGNLNRKHFRNQTYVFESYFDNTRGLLFILNIQKKHKWHITLKLNYGIDIQRTVEQMKIYFELLNHLKFLGYDKRE